MKTLDVVQGSLEWFMGRCGKHKASRSSDMLAKTKSGWGASRDNYEGEIACELLTKKMEQSFVTATMQRGIDLEPKARSALELVLGLDIKTVGLCIHSTMDDFVASPDGLIENDGLVEIKCPNTATIIDYHLKNEVPQKYILQIQSQLAVTEREYCIFCAYDDRLPADLSLFIKKVQRDDKMIKMIETETRIFMDGCYEKVSKLRKLREAA